MRSVVSLRRLVSRGSSVVCVGVYSNDDDNDDNENVDDDDNTNNSHDDFERE